MIDDRVLDLAVAKGLIQPGQALALRSLARQEGPDETSHARPEPIDEEKLRFVSGFADIFVTIGLALFLGSAAYLIDRRLDGASTAAAVALLAWALAEFFTRRRRMALPSIALLLVFTLASFMALGSLLGEGTSGRSVLRFGWLGGLLGANRDPLPVALAGLGTAALAGLHYWRFRVPITVAAGIAGLAVTVVALLAGALPDVAARFMNGILFGLGLAIFALAMRFDLADPERATRRTDIAFWLHLLASPLIVHSVFQAVGAGRGIVETPVAVAIILVFAALGTVAVTVDRRAMLVSGLVYAGVAFGSLIRRSGLTDLGVPLTLLILGALVLALSAGWTPLRSALLRRLPAGLAARLPRPLAV